MTIAETETEVGFNVFEDVAPYDDTDDGKEHLTHIINEPDNLHIWQPGMKTKEIVDIARITGQEVVALCGYRWVPNRDPEKHPPCKACFDIAAQIISEDG